MLKKCSSSLPLQSRLFRKTEGSSEIQVRFIGAELSLFSHFYCTPMRKESALSFPPTQAFHSWLETSTLWSPLNHHSDLLTLVNIPPYQTSTLSTEHCMTKDSCSKTLALYLSCLCTCESVHGDSSVESRAFSSCENTSPVVCEAPLPTLSLTLSLVMHTYSFHSLC